MSAAQKYSTAVNFWGYIMKATHLKAQFIILAFLLILQSAILCVPRKEKVDNGEYSLAAQ